MSLLENRGEFEPQLPASDISQQCPWTRSQTAKLRRKLHHLTVPPDSGQLMADKFMISNLCFHVRTEGKPAFIFGLNFSSLRSSLLSSYSWNMSRFHAQRKHFELRSKWSRRFDGGTSKRMEKTRTLWAHSAMSGEQEARLSLMFGNPAEPLMEDQGAGARLADSLIYAICHVNMFKHRPVVTLLLTLSLILTALAPLNTTTAVDISCCCQ